jgi:gluconolactonase
LGSGSIPGKGGNALYQEQQKGNIMTALKASAVLWLGLCLMGSDAFAQPVMRGDGPAPEAQPFRINKVDAKLDAILAPDAELELMADGFGLNEGPVWVRDGSDGYLIVSGLIDNALYKITPDKTVSVFMEYAGYSGDNINNVGTQTRSGRQHVLLIGPGCASLDPQNRLVWCAMQDLAIKRLEADGSITTLADNHEGKSFSGPNDLVVKSNGSIYFTDNDYGLRDAGNSPLKQMPNGIWLVKDGKTQRLLNRVALGGPPNGIALAEDEKFLYLTAGPKLMKYAIKADDTLGAASLFTSGEGIGDGVKVDRKGNVYSSGGAGPGIIRITAKDGTFLGSLHLPIYGKEPKKQICATNLGFGDNDGQALYITACDAVYKIRLKAQGILPGKAP